MPEHVFRRILEFCGSTCRQCDTDNQYKAAHHDSGLESQRYVRSDSHNIEENERILKPRQYFGSATGDDRFRQ